MSQLEVKNDIETTKSEMMRYRVNSTSYTLGFIGIGLSLLAAFVCLNSTRPATVSVIIKILMNIAILLFGFLCVEKAKAYSRQASWALVGIGGVCALRILWIPLQLITNWSKWLAAEAAGDAEGMNQAGKYLGETITGYLSDAAVRWLPNDGYFRGYAAIALLAVASVCFIVAGLYGVKRAVRLENFMKTLEAGK